MVFVDTLLPLLHAGRLGRRPRIAVLLQSSLSAPMLCIQEMAALIPMSPSIGSTDLGQKVKTSACPVYQYAPLMYERGQERWEGLLPACLPHRYCQLA